MRNFWLHFCGVGRSHSLCKCVHSDRSPGLLQPLPPGGSTRDYFAVCHTVPLPVSRTCAVRGPVEQRQWIEPTQLRQTGTCIVLFLLVRTNENRNTGQWVSCPTSRLTTLEQEGSGKVVIAFLCCQSPTLWPAAALGRPLLPLSQGHGQLARPGLLNGDQIAICRNNLTMSICYLLCLD